MLLRSCLAQQQQEAQRSAREGRVPGSNLELRGSSLLVALVATLARYGSSKEARYGSPTALSHTPSPCARSLPRLGSRMIDNSSTLIRYMPRVSAHAVLTLLILCTLPAAIAKDRSALPRETVFALSRGVRGGGRRRRRGRGGGQARRRGQRRDERGRGVSDAFGYYHAWVLSFAL